MDANTVASFVNTVFNGNSAYDPNSLGGAICMDAHAVASFVNTVFSGNSAPGLGGGIYGKSASNMKMDNVSFTKNTRSISDYVTPVTLRLCDCLFPCNSTDAYTRMILQRLVHRSTKSQATACAQDQFFCKKHYSVGLVQAMRAFDC